MDQDPPLTQSNGAEGDANSSSRLAPRRSAAKRKSLDGDYDWADGDEGAAAADTAATGGTSLARSSAGQGGMASSFSTVGAAGHRASCHRCGNLRKRNVFCSRCPHTFCERCASKLVAEHGDIFSKGCPLCLGLCCCGDPRGTHVCNRLHHCYKKCGATRSNKAGEGAYGDFDGGKLPLMTEQEADAITARYVCVTGQPGGGGSQRISSGGGGGLMVSGGVSASAFARAPATFSSGAARASGRATRPTGPVPSSSSYYGHDGDERDDEYAWSPRPRAGGGAGGSTPEPPPSPATLSRTAAVYAAAVNRARALSMAMSAGLVSPNPSSSGASYASSSASGGAGAAVGGAGAIPAAGGSSVGGASMRRMALLLRVSSDGGEAPSGSGAGGEAEDSEAPALPAAGLLTPEREAAATLASLRLTDFHISEVSCAVSPVSSIDGAGSEIAAAELLVQVAAAPAATSRGPEAKRARTMSSKAAAAAAAVARTLTAEYDDEELATFRSGGSSPPEMDGVVFTATPAVVTPLRFTVPPVPAGTGGTAPAPGTAPSLHQPRPLRPLVTTGADGLTSPPHTAPPTLSSPLSHMPRGGAGAIAAASLTGTTCAYSTGAGGSSGFSAPGVASGAGGNGPGTAGGTVPPSAMAHPSFLAGFLSNLYSQAQAQMQGGPLHLPLGGTSSLFHHPHQQGYSHSYSQHGMGGASAGGSLPMGYGMTLWPSMQAGGVSGGVGYGGGSGSGIYSGVPSSYQMASDYQHSQPTGPGASAGGSAVTTTGDSDTSTAAATPSVVSDPPQAV